MTNMKLVIYSLTSLEETPPQEMQLEFLIARCEEAEMAQVHLHSIQRMVTNLTALGVTLTDTAKKLVGESIHTYMDVLGYSAPMLSQNTAPPTVMDFTESFKSEIGTKRVIVYIEQFLRSIQKGLDRISKTIHDMQTNS